MKNDRDVSLLYEVYDESNNSSNGFTVGNIQGKLDIILERREKNRGVLAIIITLLLKKISSPNQDIRLHQRGMSDVGFSARMLDTAVVTPFLKEQNFPYMVGGSGALTRSLEQPVPFDMNYTGRITPKETKWAFLTIIDEVQNKGGKARDILIYILKKLIEYRDRDGSIKLIKPVGKSIKEIIARLQQHSRCGGSRLPVLAIYAVYEQLLKEVKKYDKHQLCKLQPHNSADFQSGFLGDIQVNDCEGRPFEAIEIKHEIGLTAELVEDCYIKFSRTPVQTYYLLSTNEKIDDINAISNKIMSIQKNHGCQMIVNGVYSTLRYYLRLLSNPDNFLSSYVNLMENECDYQTKQSWDELWEN